MKLKRFIVILIIAVILIAQFAWLKFNNKVYAADDIKETVAILF